MKRSDMDPQLARALVWNADMVAKCAMEGHGLTASVSIGGGWQKTMCADCCASWIEEIRTETDMTTHALNPVEITWGEPDQFGRQELHAIQHCACGVGYELEGPVDTEGGRAVIKDLAEQDLARKVGRKMDDHVAGRGDARL